MADAGTPNKRLMPSTRLTTEARDMVGSEKSGRSLSYKASPLVASVSEAGRTAQAQTTQNPRAHRPNCARPRRRRARTTQGPNDKSGETTEEHCGQLVFKRTLGCAQSGPCVVWAVRRLGRASSGPCAVWSVRR